MKVVLLKDGKGGRHYRRQTGLRAELSYKERLGKGSRRQRA